VRRFDWTHASILYPLTRIGEDFPYSPVDLFTQAAAYAAAGIGAAALASLVRQRGRPSEYLGDSAHF